MDPLIAVLLVVLALAGGLALGWFARGRVTADDTVLLTRLSASEANVTALREQLMQREASYREYTERARDEQEAHRERERQEARVLTALSPVAETLHNMQRAMASMERDRQEQFGQLGEQLRQAQINDESLRQATNTLASALRSTTTRGTWGETQLRRVVEAAGLTHHVDFDVQTSITTESGATGRPDMIVRLPGGKAIALDAKAPLDAYLEASARDSDAERAAALTQHARAVKSHVDALAKRQYWTGLESSPEFVICFLPNEAMLSAALDSDPTLLDYAFRQRVALASPVSLWAVLKSVAYTWTQDEVSAEAHQLFALGNQLYDRLGALAGHADDLRKAIERTVGAYNKFAGSLESRVLVTARKFPGIDATKLAQMPAPAEVSETPRALVAAEFANLDDTAPARDGIAEAEFVHDNVPAREAEADGLWLADLADDIRRRAND
ncbi:DNA recombination protein RmuC [Microbacterium sp. NC79]|uniref:DNA recombination protein RmuC n=1 Tax=Microbacterium sp. NC79 TaxID=2851009 RepID=UPI001C2C16FF|nr:DNA recombination protein RmuC [Microbacterium sp. NC79]MBV0894453.1 DNA recombination protein RmuC [Microbacterium sp. NC79]